MKIGIEHIGIFSDNTEALRDWYIEMFGWTVVYDNGKGTYFLKADDGSMVELCKTDLDGGKHDMKATGLRHLAISVSVDDFNALAEKLNNAGVKVLTPANVNDKGIGTMFFEDLDGNVLHLIARPTAL
ncbi:MAG: VOC family protein [Clostridia bacterium]|nr:VOC family protein [Clostridia bacterium]